MFNEPLAMDKISIGTEAHPARTLCGREDAEAGAGAKLLDWPVYPRLSRTMQALKAERKEVRVGGVVQSECSICWLPIAMVQGCCLLSQTEKLGPAKSGSANIPTATAIRFGRCSA
jgi:hypothetical protein